MNPNIKQKIFSYFVLLILTLSMLYPSSVALADDTPPPPEETQEPTPPPEETEEPALATEETEEPAPPPEETQDPVSSTEESPAQDVTPDPTGEIVVEGAGTEAPTEEVAPDQTGEEVVEEPERVTTILEQLPEGTNLVVLDQNGEEEPLATQEAAETIATGDPYIERDGVTHRFLADCTGQPVDAYNTCTETTTPIQDAIDYSLEGETIYVEPGIYNEQIVINTIGITLMGLPGNSTAAGADLNAPVIQGSGTGSGTGITINAGGVTLTGFVIQGWDQAILVDVLVGKTAVNIDNNTIQNNDDGIQVVGGQGKPGTNIHYNIFSDNTGEDLINNGPSDNNVQDVDARFNYWGCPEGPVIAFKNPDNNNDWDYIVWAERDDGNPNNYTVYDDNPLEECGILYGRDSLWNHGGGNYKPYKIIIDISALPETPTPTEPTPTEPTPTTPPPPTEPTPTTPPPPTEPTPTEPTPTEPTPTTPPPPTEPTPTTPPPPTEPTPTQPTPTEPTPTEPTPPPTEPTPTQPTPTEPTPTEPVPGCTDPNATNYNSNATVDDGSCVYPPIPVPGCTDPLATNYNPKATVDDGSCVYPPVLGCTDPFALNYSSSAIINDGSCRYPLTPPEPPVLVSSFIPVTGGELHAIAAGIAHTCAITPEGGVQCWGNNDYGQLGNGTYTSSNFRVDVTGLLGATTIVAGGDHTCVLSGSDVWCWGQNSSGQLGDGTTADRNVPVKVLSGVVDITAGYDFTCATLLNGQAMCWGNNDKGQVTSDGQAVYPSPTLAKLMSGLSQIDAGRNKNCGLTPAGLVRCVSGSTSEELGDPSAINLNVAVNRFGPSVIALNDQGVPIQFLYGEPRMVNQLSAVQDIDSGFGHICALQSTGSVECWGANNYGQLGNNSKDRSADPVAVQNLYSAWQLAVGRNHTCVMSITNEPGDPGIQCWGLNTDGQLGDGTTETSLVPVKVK